MKKFCLFLLSSIILLLSSGVLNPAKAGIGQPPVLQVLNGSLGQLSKDSFNIVSDTIFFDPSYNSMLDKHYLVRNTIRLRIDPYSPFFLKQNFSATIRLEISKTDANGTVTSFDTALTVRYNKDSLIRDEDNYLFSNAYRVKVKVIDRQTDASWDVWKTLKLENELQSFPLFNFDCTRDTVLSLSHAALDSGTVSDELSVSWTQVTGADQYDLEWTYIDSSALKSARQPYGTPSNPNASLIFESGCSRVTVTGTTYNIPLMYDGAGTLFFRVRPVQLQAGGGRTEGHWTSDKQAPGSFYFKGHQRNLNWQSTASYAEEGKRKVVVQYYDGSLRGRQTVTKDNTTNTTVVAESFYDYQGRPVIQVLPAPTFSNVIKYSQNFNLGLNGAYDKNDFDSLANPSQYCGLHANAMGTGSGASQYYSTANPGRDSGIAKYIPDAGGYPFTEVEYLQDNTGRISRQSGVGPRHQLGGGHETKYFYGTPDQHELDALFGTEVGDYSHYFKTVVEDANGQFSVSYTDMHGRTIATALAGVPDSTRLDTLSTYRSQLVTETLSTPASNVVKDLVMESKKGLVVTVPSLHTFNYKLNPASLQLADCNNRTVCYDCLYDLEITMTSDCNNQHIPGGQAWDTVIHNFSLGGRPDTTCGKQADSFYVSFTKWLDAGSYEITKRLSVSRYGEDYYRDNVFMLRNSCKNVDSFLREQRTIQAGITQCKPDCQSCNDSLGTWSQFYQRYIARAGIAAGDSSYKDIIQTAYNEAQASCRLLCDSANEIDDMRQAMLLDMTPPSGQYANIDSSDDKFSIFYVHFDAAGNPTDTTEPLYTKPSINYLDENGNPDLVYDETTDRMVRPQDLTPEAFAQKFKLSWAAALLPYHPEYAKLQIYQNYTTSAAWDRRFEATDTYAEARQKGYLNPTHNTGTLFSRFDATGTADYDSSAASFGSSLNNSLQLFISKAKPVSGTFNMTLWGFATATVRCAGRDASCFNSYESSSNDNNAFNSGLCAGDMDMAWRVFRQAYLDLKRKLINAQMASITPSTQTLIDSSHQPHFSDADELMQAAGLTPPSDTATAGKNSRDSLNSYYDANCRAYVAMWWQQLKPCNYGPADSAIIIPRLIQVCKEGSDGSHPYGSSSIRPGSSNQYSSFEDVIEQYNAGQGKPAACNAYAITAPKPYDQQLAYNNKPLWTLPDSCECARIQTVYQQYQAVSSHYLSFSDYMFKAYHTTIADSTLTQLRNLCSVPPGSASCNYQATPIQLPPALQCSTGDVCVGCTQFKTLDAAFRTKYPGLAPVATALPTDSAQLTINGLYEQYMNYHLGYTKTTAEYLGFLNSCNGVSSTVTDSLQRLRDDFNQSYYPDTMSIAENHFYVQGPPNGIVHADQLPLVFNNGIEHIPASISPYPRPANDFTYYYKFDTFCVHNEFMVEERVRKDVEPQRTVVDLGIQYNNGANNGTFQAIFVLLPEHPTAADTSNVLFNGCCGNFMILNRGGADTYVRFPIPVFANITDWTTIGIKHTRDSLQVYLNRQYLCATYMPDSIYNITNVFTLFTSRVDNGNIDNIKVYDKDGSLRYSEEFEDARQSMSNYPADCQPDCRTGFTNYFNQRTGHSYTANQVDSIYRRYGVTLPCSVQTRVDSVVAVPTADTCKKFSFLKTYGSSGQDQANSFIQVSDGGYAIAGQSNGVMGMDGFVMRTDKKGNVIWSKIYNNSGARDTIVKIRLMHDGNYLVLGNTNGFGYSAGASWLMAVSATNGSVLWTRILGSSGHGSHAIDAIETSDQGFVVASVRDYNTGVLADWQIFRLNNFGMTSWKKVYKSTEADIIGGIVEDGNNIVIAGYTSTDNSDYNGVIKKIGKSNGAVIWTKSYDIEGQSNWFFQIYKTLNGYLINTIETDSYTPNSATNIKLVIVETDTAGTITRATRQPALGSTLGGNPAIFPASDGGVVFTQGENSTNADVYVRKSGTDASRLWANQIQLTGDQHATAILQNADGTYAAVGYSDSHVLLLRTDTLGRGGCLDGSIVYNKTGVTPSLQSYSQTLEDFTDNNDLETTTATTGFEGLGSLCVNDACQARATITDTLFLCGRSEPVFPPASVDNITNCSDSTFFAVSKSMEFMKVYSDSLTNKFDSAYRAKCMQAYLYEQFTVTHNVSEYHHTLYYYDQAGNLLKTVPPSGVHANYDPVWLDNVAAARNADQSLVPAHGLNTQYRYNTLNQVVTQQTPDAGQSRFWYDRLGRLAISQNARQKYISVGEQGRQYSYTLYDYIGRITEVGQIANAGTAPMTDSISRVEGNLLSWITASQANKEQITQTVYDAAYPGFTGLSFTPLAQRNLRNRVSYTSFTVGSNSAQYNQGTFYTYDIEGNVDTLLQDYGSSTFSSAQNVMNLNGNRFKRLVYQYDLVSGKVNNVAYQPHQVDAFYHRYSYDAENRITLAETSADSVHWDKEARYEYYKHGPLARVIMGDKMVQGLDYAYTLQGWLKGVNSTSLLPGFDMGRDGDTTYRNRYIAKDIYGFSLNYFAGDYAAIGTGVTPFPGSSAALSSSYRPLFNGNISSMAVNLGPLYRNQHGPADTSHWRGPLLYNYRYDQLNRITGMDAFYGLNQLTNSWAGLMPTVDFRERVSYDGNGNIQQYKRNNFGETGLPMDSLGYKYLTGTNKLSWITDSADDAVGGGYDLHNQPVGNYAYDSIGNLIKDSVERISAIKWNVYGKIIEIDHRSTTAANPTKNIYYYYDAAGNRIGKKVTRGDTSAATYTWYVRDASGNVMSTYTARLDSSQALGNADLQLNEQHIYGSSRLGVLTANRTVDANTEGLNNYVSPWTGLHLPWYTGRKQYELANHLGNVLATISDKKIGVSLAADSSLIDHYEADVKTAQDYYPFGMIMPGRILAGLNIPGGTFGGTTQVNGYTLPVDLTLTGRTGNQPTSYVATDLIDLNDGFESGTNDDVTAYIADGSYAGGGNGSNDNAVAGGGYRYGFNGKENDNEVKGTGDQIDYGNRIYDPRSGRFLSVDPLYKKFPMLTPYQYASNTPVQAIDLDGLEGITATGGYPPNDQNNLPPSLDFRALGNAYNPRLSTQSSQTPPTQIASRRAIIAKQTKCHPDGEAVTANIVAQNLIDYAKLDHSHGQIAFPRSRIWTFLGGTRTLGKDEVINGKQYWRNNIIDDNGYITNQSAPRTGIPPPIGLKGIPFGSGPVPGVIELSERVQSTGAFENAVTTTAKDFIYDPNLKVFLMAGKEYKLGHSGLVRAIGADENIVVGGRIKQGEDGIIEVSQWSGHYGGNWTPEIAQKLQTFIKNLTNKDIRQTGTHLFRNGTGH